MTQTARPLLQLEHYLQPQTGERARLSFDGQTTRLERGGQVTPQTPPAFDEAAEREKLREQMEQSASAPEFRMWREMLIGRLGSREAARQEFLRLGLPQKLWDELDTFDRRMGRTPSDAPNIVPPDYSSVLVTAEEVENSLLWNPPAELRRRFAGIWAAEMNIVPPGADTGLWERSLALAREGFIRLTPRRPDGTVWLPPALEPHRAQLQGLEQPVVRPYPKAGQPAPWDSKFGGVPYRPSGSAWPLDAHGAPLPFLAQINLAQANAEGHLPDLPRRGLLQFFVSHAGERVLYWPDPVQNEATLTREVPELEDYQEAMFSPPEQAMGFVPDSEIPSSLDDRLSFARPTDESDQRAEYNSKLQANGHRLRGYPMVINSFHPAAENVQLLFQFDGDDFGGQLFGQNGGLGGWLGFFIRPSDLAKLDFSRVWAEMDAF
ncbi:MAG: YwqG family protein [Deinococcus sp.]|uniref:YwqG family protein n=1 Tax=Deinococcus sp. TaxID=47478 RepID=UPI0026DC9923|nr:YwqG family protein [Deinococcus sp.]MDO4247208.1 YwqG family protein [Deinococcus sp.]